MRPQARASQPEKDIIAKSIVSRTHVLFLEFRCYFCDEPKNEEPFYFGLANQKKEPICKRCHEKSEVVRRLRENGERKQR